MAAKVEQRIKISRTGVRVVPKSKERFHSYFKFGQPIIGAFVYHFPTLIFE
jgi:hypothetical protein